MQNKNCFTSCLDTKAFTLIELLVVVLIIGILAAVALPQYQKAVEKSRAAEALQLMKTVNQAVDTYYLSSGEWPRTFDELAVDISWTGREKGYLNSCITDVRSNGIWSIQLENNSCQSIIATRLDGPYSGAGFLIEKNCPSISPWENHELYCAEFLVGNKIFSGADGRFCTKLLGAAFKGKSCCLRAYTLPF